MRAFIRWLAEGFEPALSGAWDGGAGTAERRARKAIAPEAATREFAAKIGYDFAVLTDGTFVLEPPPDPDCCGMCADRATRCL